MLKRLSVTGSTLRPQSLEAKAAIGRNLKEKVWPLLANQTIKSVIAKTFILEEVVHAHTLMESNAHIGKIILEVANSYNSFANLFSIKKGKDHIYAATTNEATIHTSTKTDRTV